MCGGTCKRRGFLALWGQRGKRHGRGETSGVNLLSAIHAGPFCLPFFPDATRPQAEVTADHLVSDSARWCAKAFLLVKCRGLLDPKSRQVALWQRDVGSFCYFVSSQRRL